MEHSSQLNRFKKCESVEWTSDGHSKPETRQMDVLRADEFILTTRDLSSVVALRLLGHFQR